MDIFQNLIKAKSISKLEKLVKIEPEDVEGKEDGEQCPDTTGGELSVPSDDEVASFGHPVGDDIDPRETPASMKIK